MELGEEFCPLWCDSITEARVLENFFITVEFLGTSRPTLMACIPQLLSPWNNLFPLLPNVF